MHPLRRYRLSKDIGFQAETLGTRLVPCHQLHDEAGEIQNSVSVKPPPLRQLSLWILPSRSVMLRRRTLLRASGPRRMPNLVEELIDDTMIEVWRKRASIRENASVAVWIMGLAYSHGQKRVAEVGVPWLHSQLSELHTEPDSPRSTTLEASSRLDESLLSLPVEERVLLHLVYVGGYSRRDVAAIMNISCEGVDMLLSEARFRRGYAQG